jgi:hypothetical protein
MPALLSDRPAPSAAPVAAPRRRRRIPVRLVVAGAAVAVLVPAGLEIRDWLAGFGDSFEPEIVDRSTPPLLLALEDLSEYRAAAADLQVVIDVETDTPWVPSVISGERVSFLATGTADAYVDFEQIGEGAVTLSPDGSSATIVLPAPELGEVRIDPENSRVLDRDRGMVERLGDAIGENPSDDSELYALAERRLAAAAAQSDVLDRAEANTRDMLTTLAMSLGVERVTVDFEEPVGSDG